MIIFLIIYFWIIGIAYYAIAYSAISRFTNYPFSKQLDSEINKLLDADVKFTNVREYDGYVDLGHLKNIWIYNYPYALGNCVYGKNNKKYMPSPKTCLRLKEKLSKVLDKVRLDYLKIKDYAG